MTTEGDISIFVSFSPSITAQISMVDTDDYFFYYFHLEEDVDEGEVNVNVETSSRILTMVIVRQLAADDFVFVDMQQPQQKNKIFQRSVKLGAHLDLPSAHCSLSNNTISVRFLKTSLDEAHDMVTLASVTEEPLETMITAPDNSSNDQHYGSHNRNID